MQVHRWECLSSALNKLFPFCAGNRLHSKYKHSCDLWPFWLSRPCMTIWWTSWLTAASTTRLRTSWSSWARHWSIRSTSSSWRSSALSLNANNLCAVRTVEIYPKLWDTSGSDVMTEWRWRQNSFVFNFISFFQVMCTLVQMSDGFTGRECEANIHEK